MLTDEEVYDLLLKKLSNNTGILRTIRLEKRIKPKVMKIVRCDQVSRVELYFGNKLQDRKAWNRCLALANLILQWYRCTSFEEQQYVLSLFYQLLADDSCSMPVHYSINDLKAYIKTLKPSNMYVLKDVLRVCHPDYFSIIPESNTVNPWSYPAEHDPMGNWMNFQVDTAIDKGTYSFLANQNINSLLTNQKWMIETIQQVFEALKRIAYTQAPYYGTAWMYQEQQTLYERRLKELEYRKKEVNHLEKLAKLYVFSMTNTALSDISIVTYQKILALARETWQHDRLKIPLHEACHSSVDKICQDLLDSLLPRIPLIRSHILDKQQQYMYLIMLHHQFSLEKKGLLFFDYLDQVWQFGNKHSSLYSEYSKSKSVVKAELPVETINFWFKLDNFYMLMENLPRYFTDAAILNVLQNNEYQSLALKKMSLSCIHQVYIRQIAIQNIFWSFQSPLDFYVAIMLPKTIMPTHTNFYEESSLTACLHLALFNHHVRHHVQVIMVSLLAAMMNPKIAYDKANKMNQSYHIEQTLLVIRSYLKELENYLLGEPIQQAVLLINDLLSQELSNRLLSEPVKERQFVVGYRTIENILNNVLTSAMISVLSIELGFDINARVIMQQFTQKILRNKLLNDYNQYKLNKLSCCENSLMNQMAIAVAYLDNDDLLVNQFEQDTEAFISILIQSIQMNRISKKDALTLNQNYKILLLHRDRRDTYEKAIESYLNAFQGNQIELADIFFNIGMPINNLVWPKSAYSYRYFETLMIFYFNGNESALPAIKTSKEFEYFSIFSRLFIEYGEKLHNFQIKFEDNLVSFYQNNRECIKTILKATELFVSDNVKKQKIRSDLFITLFNDEKNTRELGYFISIFEQHHADKTFEFLITMDALHLFESNLNARKMLIKNSSAAECLKLVGDEKWIMLVYHLFHRHKEDYIQTLIAALIRIAMTENKLDDGYFELVVSNLINQLPRDAENHDRVQLHDMDYLFDLQSDWHPRIGLLVKHFGSELLEARYFIQFIEQLMKMETLQDCIEWNSRFKVLYSAQTVKELYNKYSNNVYLCYVANLEKKLQNKPVRDLEILISSLIDNQKVRQCIYQARLRDIMRINEAKSQIVDYIIIDGYFDESKLFLELKALDLESLKRKLKVFYGSEQFLIHLACDYLRSESWNDSSIAMNILRNINDSSIYSEEYQMLLKMHFEAFNKEKNMKNYCETFNINCIINAFNNIWTLLPDSNQVLMKKHVMPYVDNQMSILSSFNLSMIIYKELLKEEFDKIPSEIENKLFFCYNKFVFELQKCQQLLEEYLPNDWLLARTYASYLMSTSLLSKPDNSLDLRLCRRAIRNQHRFSSSLSLHTVDTELTGVECHNFLSKSGLKKEISQLASKKALNLLYQSNDLTLISILKDRILEKFPSVYETFNHEDFQLEMQNFHASQFSLLKNNEMFQDQFKTFIIGHIDDYFRVFDDWFSQVSQADIRLSSHYDDWRFLLILKKSLDRGNTEELYQLLERSGEHLKRLVARSPIPILSYDVHEGYTASHVSRLLSCCREAVQILAESSSVQKAV